MIKRLIIFCGTFVFKLQNHTSQTITTQQLPLGYIGIDKGFLLQETFNNMAIPKYKACSSKFATSKHNNT